jgi:hypothetical protein
MVLHRIHHTQRRHQEETTTGARRRNKNRDTGDTYGGRNWAGYSMDTQMPEASEPSDAQKKRTGEKASGSRKKAKAHKTPMQTSLTTDDVETDSHHSRRSTIRGMGEC